MSLRRSAGLWRAAAGLATILAGLLTLVSSVTRDRPWRDHLLAPIEPGPAQHVAHIAGVAGGLALLLLGYGVLRGRRRAVHAAPAVLCVVAVVHAAKGLDYEEALVALGIAALLRTGMRATAAGGRPSRALMAGTAAAVALTGAFAVCLASALALPGIKDLDHATSVAASATWRAAQGDVSAVAGVPGELLHVLLAVAVLAVLLALRAPLSPVTAEDGHDAEEHRRAAEIVARHGRCSIAPFVLRADKAFFFAHGGVVAYRLLRDTAVVSGDPVGPPGTAPAILKSFAAFAARREWDVVIMAASEHHLAGYRALGLRTLRIGSEAVAVPGQLQLSGGRHKSLRKAINRVERRGWTVDAVPAADLGQRQLAELGEVESRWRARHERLTGFSMARDRLWGAPEDNLDLYVLGRDPDGALHGFLRFLPYDGGLSLDATRRLGGEPNGFTEAMVVAGLRHAADHGYREVSLNFAGFAHLMDQGARLGPLGRLARAGLRLVHGRFQLERLARFSARFDPDWRPRYLVYSSALRLPWAALRVLQAEAYVRAPRTRRRVDGWKPADQPQPQPQRWPVAGAVR